jgi:chemotaxis protein CheD
VTSTSFPPRPPSEISVGVAQWAVLRHEGTLWSHGLGSCVAIVLYDASTRTAGLVHILLPNESYSRDRSKASKFADAAVPHLITEMRRAGARGALTAKIVGGASMFGSLLAKTGVNMGSRNIASAREALRKAGIRIVGEDVGGDFGRTIAVSVADGNVKVRSVDRGTNEV